MTSVYLLRHAKAQSRVAWREPDRLRPLTRAGMRQAEALPVLYGGEPLSRLLTSPFVRCVQTVEPLAEARGLELELNEALAEGAPAAEAFRLVRSVATDGPAVFCTHGDVLLETLADLRSAGVPLQGPLECRKGSTWVLDIDGEDVVEGRYLEPPTTARGGS